MFKARLGHVGIIVSDMERVEELLLLLGLEKGHTQYVAEYQADCVFTSGPGGVIEFVVPRGGKLQQFNRGAGGLHHVALEVDDLRAVTEALKKQDVELLEKEPVDAGDIWINFLPPIYTRGFTVEFIQSKEQSKEQSKDPAPKEEAPMADQLLDTIKSQASRYPEATQTALDLIEQAPNLLKPGMEFLINKRPGFWPVAEKLVRLSKSMGGVPAEAVIEYTVAYLKEQALFMRTKEYSNKSFDDVRRDVYDNPEVMKKFYLDGLMLTHAYWPIHFDIHEFFLHEFVSRVPEEGTGTEYGFGHGLYLAEVLTRKPKTTVRAFDISEHARAYASKLLEQHDVPSSRYALGFADVRQPFEAKDGEYRFAVFAEIVEHIPDPLFSLRELRRTMAANAPVFITTVVNSNAIDHIYMFRETKEVPPLLEQAGFEIVASKVLKVSDYGTSRDPSIDVAYVCIPA